MLPSGKHTKNYGKSPLLIGKSTINGLFSIVMLVYQRVIGYKWIWYHMISYDIMKYHWWAASEHGVFHGTPALMAIWIANMMIKQWIWMYLLFRKCHVIFFYIMLIIRWIIPYEIGLTCFYSKHFEACFYSCMNFTYGFFKVQHLITSPCRPKFAIGNVSVSSGGDVSVRSCDVHLRVARPRGLRGAIDLSGCWRCFGHRSKLKTNWEPRIFWAYLYA